MEKLIFTYGLLTGVAASFVFVFISICVIVRGGMKNEPDAKNSTPIAKDE